MMIFVISLKQSHERREFIQANLKGVDFKFFDADVLSEMPDHHIYNLYNPKKTRLYKGYTLTTSELGCFASHISLWEKSVEFNTPILILEDSIELTGNLKSYLPTIENLVTDLGILKLYNIYSRKNKVIKKVNSSYNVISNLKGGCGTQAYAITPTAAQNYLNLVNGFFEPVDDFMENEWRTKQTVFSLIPHLVKRRQIASTIGSRKIKESLSIKNKLNIEFYRLYKQSRQFLYNVFYK